MTIQPSPPREDICPRKSRVLNRDQLQEALDNVGVIHTEFAVRTF